MIIDNIVSIFHPQNIYSDDKTDYTMWMFLFAI